MKSYIVHLYGRIVAVMTSLNQRFFHKNDQQVHAIKQEITAVQLQTQYNIRTLNAELAATGTVKLAAAIGKVIIHD